MGNRTHIIRMVDGFSSHTQRRPRTRGSSPGADRAGACDDPATLREQLIAAAVEVLAGGSDPRLAQSRALA